MTDIDPIAIERVTRGRATHTTLNRDEQRQLVHILTGQGHSAHQIADTLGVSDRTVQRWRREPPPVPITPAATTLRWRDRALCREIGPDLFLPPDGTEEEPLYSPTRAKAVCAACPVRPDCLEDAMAREGDVGRHERYGVWGGLSPTQRAALARVRHKEPA